MSLNRLRANAWLGLCVLVICAGCSSDKGNPSRQDPPPNGARDDAGGSSKPGIKAFGSACKVSSECGSGNCVDQNTCCAMGVTKCAGPCAKCDDKGACTYLGGEVEGCVGRCDGINGCLKKSSDDPCKSNEECESADCYQPPGQSDKVCR